MLENVYGLAVIFEMEFQGRKASPCEFGLRDSRHFKVNLYARMDFRLTPEGKIHVLEASPTPNLSEGEDFAESAAHVGLNTASCFTKSAVSRQMETSVTYWGRSSAIRLRQSSPSAQTFQLSNGRRAAVGAGGSAQGYCASVRSLDAAKYFHH